MHVINPSPRELLRVRYRVGRRREYQRRVFLFLGYLHCLSSPIPPLTPSSVQRAVCAGTSLPLPGEVVNMARDQRTFAANCIVSSSCCSSPG